MENNPHIKLSRFTKPECDYFRENCNFTDEELEVFNLLSRGKSIVQTSFALNMTSSMVKRRSKSIKEKIYRVT